MSTELEKLPERQPEKKPEQSGQWLWKNLKPFGCILCLVLMVAMILVCLTAGTDPIPGYEPPESNEYYAENHAELMAELEEKVFPNLEGVISCYEFGERVKVVIEHEHFAQTRSAIGRYFDISLFEFEKG